MTLLKMFVPSGLKKCLFLLQIKSSGKNTRGTSKYQHKILEHLISIKLYRKNAKMVLIYLS